MFAYCRNNPVRRVDVAGTADQDCYNEDGDIFSSDDLENRDGGGGSYFGIGSSSDSMLGQIDSLAGGYSPTTSLYRAVSPEEALSAVKNQRFSAASNSYADQKFFASSQANAQKWGEKMYPDGNYKIIGAEFNSRVISSPGVAYWPRLDAIGPAYLIPISELNSTVMRIYYCE